MGSLDMPSLKQVLENHARLTALLPGLSGQELVQFRKQVGGLIPANIEELLVYSEGFDYKPVGTVRFTGHEGFEFAEVFPRAIPVLPDGCGNFWVVDISPESGAWGSVFYACHDPAVIVIQAVDLGMFLSQILSPNESNPKNALNYVRKEAVLRIWKDDPWLISVHDARTSQDPVVSNFAEQLPENFRLADLRSREVGSGFSWGLAGPNTEVRRDGAELLFGVEQKVPSFLKRVLTRTRRVAH